MNSTVANALPMSTSTSLQIPILTKTLTRVSRLPPNCSSQSPQTLKFGNIHRISATVGFNRRPRAPLAAASSPQLSVSTAADVVKEFYDGINRRDLAAVERLIGDECVYEDLVFSQPFVGRKIAGPPEFLNNAVGVGERREEAEDVDFRGRRSRARREKKNLPAGN